MPTRDDEMARTTREAMMRTPTTPRRLSAQTPNPTMNRRAEDRRPVNGARKTAEVQACARFERAPVFSPGIHARVLDARKGSGLLAALRILIACFALMLGATR